MAHPLYPTLAPALYPASSAQSGTSDHGARIPLLSCEEMTPEQRQLYEKVTSGPRGQMIGPLRAALHSPELAERWSGMGEFLRYKTVFPKRLSELAIIVSARRWNAQVEWWVHAREGMNAGISEQAIGAILECQSPTFTDIAEYEIYEFSRLLQETGQAPLGLHQAIVRRWKVQGVVELTALIGYYTMVAMTLNAHHLPIPDGTMPLPESAELSVLKPARLCDETTL